MKLSKKAIKISKNIFRASMEDDKLNEATIERFVNLLKVSESNLAKEILLHLTKQIENFENQKLLILESPFKLDPDSEKALKDRFEKILKKKLEIIFKENKELIAGIRIKNADHQWENTIFSNLEFLKGNLN